MTQSPPSALVQHRRIVVALDTSERGRAAIEAAVRLALSTSAELQGLFIEDEDLVRLASLPFSCEIDMASAVPRRLQAVEVERALRAAAEGAQRAFATALDQVNLHWTFRIVRGTMADAPLAAAGDVDLLVIGHRGRGPHVISADSIRPRRGTDKRVVAIYDGSPSSAGVLELAAKLADPDPIIVLVLAEHGNEAARQCLAWLNERGIRAEVDQATKPVVGAISDFVRKWPPSVLLINRDSPFVSEAERRSLVDEFDCPLILC